MSRESADNLNSTETSRQKAGRKSVFVLGDYMLNNIREHGLSKRLSVKIKNFLGATTERINEEIDDTFQTKLDLLILHASTNDVSAKINPSDNLRKILKKPNKLSSETKLTF